MTPRNGVDQAAAVRAANGRPAPAQPMPMGIRVTKGPGAPQATEAASAAPSTPRGAEELLRLAAGSDLARTRHLGEKIASLVADLAARIDVEQAQRQEREAAEAKRRELAEAEATLASQLAEVRQKLRSTRDSTASVTASGGRREGAERRAEIRAWAVANGYEVAERGRIAERVVQAWAAATGSEVTA
ncbi:hypothetical protein AWW66_22310 [Micromonospora rosaria]|uniref:Lsr2 DNA-binding domain-containing protein n=2 Tax=Micromonospora rosaria TaxID=47874 RepID=A0A136PMW6_9ACTN|nr:hypothetical protein AWW66_22310 [Micromonospora rosaria]